MTLALVCTLLFTALSGQPEATPRTPPPVAVEFDRDGLRQRLENRLREIRESEQALEDAIARLDAGEEPAVIVNALFRSRAWTPREMREAQAPGLRMRRERAEEERPQTDEDRGRVLAFAKQNLPELAERLESRRSREDDRVWRHIGGRVESLMDLQREDPEGARLEIEQLRLGMRVARAAKAYRDAQATGEETAAANAREILASTLAEQFDNRTAIMQHEINRLQQQIAGVEAKLKPIQSQRDQLVQQKVDQLLLRAANPASKSDADSE